MPYVSLPNMKIRNKITLIFVLLTALLLLSIFMFIYFSVKHYTEKEFYLRLKQRASITAQAYLDKDELSASIYEDIRKKHLQTLPNEKEEILKIDRAKNILISTPKSPLEMIFFNEVFDHGYAEAKIKKDYYTAILYEDNQGDFMVILSAEDRYGASKMQNLLRTLLIAYILSLCILFVIGQYYAKQVLKPISDITNQVHQIRAKNLHLRLANEHKKDELGELSKTFNTMLDRLETSFEMKSSFIHNASHELKNPLTAIIGQTEIALTNARSPEEYIKTLQTIEKEALRLNELINALLELAHTEHDSKGLIIEPIRTDELLLELKTSFESSISNKIDCNFQFLPTNPDKLIFSGNYGLIKVALLNIIDNALKYSGNKNIILSVRTKNREIQITIKDKGIGIPENDLIHVFEPFYRGGNARTFKGFGFGLSMSNKIVRLHGGTLQIDSKMGIGTDVLVILPHVDQGVKIAR